MSRARSRRLCLRVLLSLGLYLQACPAASLGASADPDLPADDSTELPSPDELLPALAEPGLPERAVPQPTPAPETAATDADYVPLYRLTRPYYDSLFSIPRPAAALPADPSAFRPVTVYEPPVGLLPRAYRPGLFELYPWGGVAQTFDSNVNLSPTNRIADFYVTPRAGLEFQLGTPDSVFVEQYDTIVAAHGSYEGWADLFYLHPGMSAYNQRLDLSARIGRSAAIWRPFFQFSDITGSNLQLAELVNRTTRIRALAGLFSEYKFTELTSARQTFTWSTFQHPDPAYIDMNTLRARQEFTYRALADTRALLWGEYRHTEVTRGSSGGEFLFGTGWQGRPDPRLYSELWIGWGILDLDGSQPGRRDLSGLRFNGYTTFDWGPRFRLTLRYDRDYVFNELDVNDNYVSTLLQLKGEFCLGGSWYVTPYLGVDIDQFETSGRWTSQVRPELEISYAFAGRDEPAASRVFVKAGYVHAETFIGAGEPIDGFRASAGWAWKF
jgi:hypothetical protein